MNRVDAEVSAAALQREGVQATIVNSQYKPGTWLVVARDDNEAREVFYSREYVEAYVRLLRKQRVCADAAVEPLTG